MWISFRLSIFLGLETENSRRGLNLKNMVDRDIICSLIFGIKPWRLSTTMCIRALWSIVSKLGTYCADNGLMFKYLTNNLFTWLIEMHTVSNSSHFSFSIIQYHAMAFIIHLWCGNCSIGPSKLSASLPFVIVRPFFVT